MAPATVLRKLAVYETHSRYYLVGRTKSRQEWRVLKINRLVTLLLARLAANFVADMPAA